MNILSFDVATKSLAVSLISYNENIQRIQDKLDAYMQYKLQLDEFNDLHSHNNCLLKFEELLKFTNDNINDSICIKYLEVKDLIPGKKLSETNTIDRTLALHNYLKELDLKLNELLNSNIQNLYILVEYQMGPNDKSRVISSQLLLHFMKYVESNSPNIHLIGPTLKNTIHIGSGDDGIYSNFVEKYKNNYTANKAHAKYNFLKLIDLLGCANMIYDIKKKNLDDIADSVMQSLSWAKKNKFI